MGHQGTLSTDFVHIHGNEMNLDHCAAAQPRSLNSYDDATYVASTNGDSAMDGYDQENDILGAQTDFEGNPKRRYKIKRGKKRSSGNRVAIYKPRGRTENQSKKTEPSRQSLRSSYSKSEDTRSVQSRMRRLQMKRLLNNPSKLSTFPDLQTKSDLSAIPRENYSSQLNKPIRSKDNVSPLIAGNRIVLDEGITSVENDYLEDGPDYSTDMGSLHWEEFKRPSIAVGIAGYNLNARIQGDRNRIIVTKGLVDSFSDFGIDDCSSNIHAQADKNGNFVMEK